MIGTFELWTKLDWRLAVPHQAEQLAAHSKTISELVQEEQPAENNEDEERKNEDLAASNQTSMVAVHEVCQAPLPPNSARDG